MKAAELPAVPGADVIHFDPPLRHARNYLGSAANLRARIAADLAGPARGWWPRRWTLCCLHVPDLGDGHARQAWTRGRAEEQRNTPRPAGPEPGRRHNAVRPRRLAKRRPNRNPARRAA